MRIRWLFVALVCLAQSPEGVQRGARYTADKQSAAEAAGKKDQPSYRAALAKMHADFPENSRVVRNLALAEAGADNSKGAADLLRLYAAMGGSLDLRSAPWNALGAIARDVPELARNDAPVTHSSRVFRLKDPDLLVEDVAYDAAGRRFFLSSVHEHKILSCDSTGACEDFAQQPDPFFALHVDAPRRVLWATTAGLDAGTSALLKFDLASRKLLQRLAPGDSGRHAMGDMTVAANGDVYVSDGTAGDVYLVSHSQARLEKLAPAGVFLSPQTPALSADGKLLYVPDYGAGIAVIRLAGRHIDWLKTSIPAALEGIDGFCNLGDRFIAVQNGIQPQRIAELHLDPHGVLDKLTVLEANWPGLGQPNHGVQVGREFYFIVNSGWERTDTGRDMKPGQPAELWKLPL